MPLLEQADGVPERRRVPVVGDLLAGLSFLRDLGCGAAAVRVRGEVGGGLQSAGQDVDDRLVAATAGVRRRGKCDVVAAGVPAVDAWADLSLRGACPARRRTAGRRRRCGCAACCRELAAGSASTSAWHSGLYRSTSTTSKSGVPIPASGQRFHHASICSRSRVASWKPCAVSGAFPLRGKTWTPPPA